MGGNPCKSLCLEYESKINLAKAKQQLGHEYRRKIISVITRYVIFGEYKNWYIIQMTLELYPENKYYMLCNKNQWPNKEQELDLMCKNDNDNHIYVHLNDTEAQDYHYIIMITAKNPESRKGTQNTYQEPQEI